MLRIKIKHCAKCPNTEFFSGPHFSAFCPNTVKYGPEKTSYLDTFHAVREKCPNTEFFLIRIFLHSDRIRVDTEYISVFSPNAAKYGPEKTPYLDTFKIKVVLAKSV